MIDAQQIKTQIENIFAAYKFTPEQQEEAISDIIEVGEALTLDALGKAMTQVDQDHFKSLFIPDMTEEKLKEIYMYVNERLTDAVVLETRNNVYNKLVTDYIAHMKG